MTNVVHGTFRESPLRNTRGTDDDLALGDVANDVLCTVIELLQGDSDLAVRTMLLAVASLTSDDETFGNATAVSNMLVEATREALDAFHSPPPCAS
jgi:hypothetical protein